MRRVIDIFRICIHGQQCVYCGFTAETWDHFPPVSAMLHGLKIPACRECNSLASNHFPFDFAERIALVKSKIRSKNKGVLNTPDWSEGEIKQIGRGMKAKVISWKIKKELVQERLAWSADLYLASIDHNNHFAQFAAEISTITRREQPSSEITSLQIPQQRARKTTKSVAIFTESKPVILTEKVEYRDSLDRLSFYWDAFVYR